MLGLSSKVFRAWQFRFGFGASGPENLGRGRIKRELKVDEFGLV